MNNKVLINLIVPFLSSSYDISIPINERIDKIIHLILVGLKDLSGFEFEQYDMNYVLINCVTGSVYGHNDVVRDTNIRNGSKLILIPNK